jgi:hypothetical protein
MNLRVTRCLLSTAALLLAFVELRADPQAPTDQGQRFELFSSITGRWARLTDLDPLKPVTGDRVVVAVSSSESFEIVLSRIEEDPSGASVFWAGRIASDSSDEAFFRFVRNPGDPRARFNGGTLDTWNPRRTFTFQVERERPGWVLVSEVERAPAGTAPKH